MHATTSGVGISGIRQISINVKDLERAKAFYRDVIGLPYLFDAPNMSFFDANGVRLMLGKAERAEFDHPASIIYYLVKDIKASHAVLVERGAHVESEPGIVAPMKDHDLWVSAYKDSEGNYFELMSEVPRVMDS